MMKKSIMIAGMIGVLSNGQVLAQQAAPVEVQVNQQDAVIAMPMPVAPQPQAAPVEVQVNQQDAVIAMPMPVTPQPQAAQLQPPVAPAEAQPVMMPPPPMVPPAAAPARRGAQVSTAMPAMDIPPSYDMPAYDMPMGRPAANMDANQRGNQPGNGMPMMTDPRGNMPMMGMPPGMMNPMMGRRMMMMRQQAMQQQAMRQQAQPQGSADSNDAAGQNVAAPVNNMENMQQRPCPMHKGGRVAGMMKQKRAMKMRHMKAMEARLANIEALLKELVELQRARQ